MGFEGPGFSFGNVLYTLLGSTLFWSYWGRTRLRVFGLSNILTLFRVSKAWSPRLEFVLFVTVGCVIGIGIVDPRNAIQALTAGFGWTGAFARPVEPGK